MLQAPNAITKKTLGNRAFMCAAPKPWNSLPYHVRNEIDFTKFKILLKTQLFNLALIRILLCRVLIVFFFNLDKVL